MTARFLSLNFTYRKGNNSEAFTIVNISISLIALMTKPSFCFFTFNQLFNSSVFYFTHHNTQHFTVNVVLDVNLQE